MTKLLYFIAGVLLLWTLLTLYAERRGPAKFAVFGENDAPKKVLIVYSPDPFYNLDEQVCTAVAQSFAERGWQAEVRTVRSAEALSEQDYQLYVFCANTYNWSPDWAVTRFAKQQTLVDKQVASITLGSGSTTRAQRRFEQQLVATGAELIASTSYWLLRPNDEARMDVPNAQVANELAAVWATSILEKIAT